jgi:hypothetical protein
MVIATLFDICFLSTSLGFLLYESSSLYTATTSTLRLDKTTLHADCFPFHLQAAPPSARVPCTGRVRYVLLAHPATRGVRGTRYIMKSTAYITPSAPAMTNTGQIHNRISCALVSCSAYHILHGERVPFPRMKCPSTSRIGASVGHCPHELHCTRAVPCL